MAEELKSIETENIAQTIAKEFKSPLEIINKEYTEIVYALPQDGLRKTMILNTC